ncbi:MAG: hypothetical protein JNK04_24650, partial [Myxococcales bacterium]|nr:hypothetical protein [Myxococcales bacterium]
MPDGLDWVASALGATIVQSQRVTSLWGGYGELLRVELEGFSARHAVVKWVRPPAGRSDRSHRRKHRSYEVETAWYRTLSSRCDDGCRVARLYASRSDGDETLLVLEDLDASGFAARRRRPAPEVLDRVLVWLASFHARFLGTEPEGLWPVGSYWHLATRPDELAQMSDDRLKAAAEWLDQKLRS